MRDYVTEKFRGLVRQPSTMTLATSTMQSGAMRATAWPDEKQFVPPSAVAWQVDLDADERLGVKWVGLPGSRCPMLGADRKVRRNGGRHRSVEIGWTAHDTAASFGTRRR
jgi:hypothetical protein